MRVSPGDEERVKAIFGVRNPRPQEYEDKAKIVTYMELLHRVNNCLGICHFNTIHGDWGQVDLPHLAELFSTATGWSTSVQDLKRLAMKQVHLEKAFNLRHTDFDRKDDLPTPRDMAEPIPGGSWRAGRSTKKNMDGCWMSIMTSMAGIGRRASPKGRL